MAKKVGNRQAVGISSAPPQPRVQMATDRMIRKAGQLHGQDRRDYKAAQEAGRGKSFMRNFQNQAAQQQQQIAREAAPLGYRPGPQQQQMQRPQQRPMQPQGAGAMGYPTGQPMRPIAQPGGPGMPPGQGMGQQIDPGYNQWDTMELRYPQMPPGFGPGPGGFQQMANPFMNQMGQWGNQGAPGIQYYGGSQGFNENASSMNQGFGYGAPGGPRKIAPLQGDALAQMKAQWGQNG